MDLVSRLGWAVKLRPNQMCPIHRRFDCCGRDADNAPPWRKKRPSSRYKERPGVRVVEDQFHPRGFRLILSPAELRKHKHKLLADPVNHFCCYCKKSLTDFREIELCHIESKGMGSARRDDHPGNLTLGHTVCNRVNGSRRVA